MKILIIEDEFELAQSIIAFISKEEYVCDLAHTFEEGNEKINLYDYDCAVIDIMLPGNGSGLDLITILRKSNPKTGIIVISAKNSLDDKLQGLDLGADDYLTKPFHLSELNARIKSVIRRRNFKGLDSIVIENIEIFPDSHELYIDKKEISLTRREFEILIYFVSNKDRVITKEAFAEHIWGDDANSFDNFDFIYTHIKNLRKKMIDNGSHDFIKSVYGVGYKFTQK